MAGLGQLKGAISQLEDFINKGVFEFEDREGQIIPTSDKLREYNQEYAAFCTQKAREYLDRSQLSLPAFPKAADDVLKQALEQFDKADPGVRTELERRRAEVGELITRWDLANSLIAEATAQQDPEKRLGLLQQAVTTYDGVENLKVMLERGAPRRRRRRGQLGQEHLRPVALPAVAGRAGQGPAGGDEGACAGRGDARRIRGAGR